jgi:hypothetical protein
MTGNLGNQEPGFEFWHMNVCIYPCAHMHSHSHIYANFRACSLPETLFVSGGGEYFILFESFGFFFFSFFK